MNHEVKSELSVSIQQLAPVRVAFVELAVEFQQGEFSSRIGDQFQTLRQWVEKKGLDPDSLLHIGIPKVAAGQLSGYECCLEAPEAIQAGSGGISLKELGGGWHAVVTMAKDPQIIGQTLDRFYTEYVLQKELEIDGQRPTLEIYYESTMEYCVPIEKE